MDAKTLDRIALRVASSPRRVLLRLLGGFVFGGGAITFIDETATAHGKHKHHKKKKKHKKKHRNAACVCGTNQTCVDGQCVTCDVCFSECPFATVQQAVNAAAPGSTIRICGGFFRPVSITKNLTLIGAGSQVGGTALRGENAGRVVTIGAGISVSLADLAINSGLIAGDGGGCLNQGALTLTNCRVSDSLAQRGGGIFNASGSSLRLVNTTVTGNQASADGGGIFNDVAGTVTLSGSSNVSGNAPDNCAGDAVPGCS